MAMVLGWCSIIARERAGFIQNLTIVKRRGKYLLVSNFVL
jgi:hypothetical protein